MSAVIIRPERWRLRPNPPEIILIAKTVDARAWQNWFWSAEHGLGLELDGAIPYLQQAKAEAAR